MKKSSASSNGSRAGTPAAQSNMARRNKAGHASTSDGEATAGEMSDSVVPVRKGVKMVGNSGKGTPVASRAGSPNPATAGKSDKPVKRNPCPAYNQLCQSLRQNCIHITNC